MWGRGLLAIWSNLERTREDDFDMWHLHEHLPERVNVPGFLRARRYLSSSATAEDAALLTLYETESVDVMASTPYLERLNNPTPLTRATVPLMEKMRRSAFRLAASRGQGMGGFLSAWQFRPSAHVEATNRLRLSRSVLAKALAPVGVIATHIFEPEVEATKAKDATAEGKATTTVSETSGWLLLIEAVHDRGLVEAREAIVEDITAASDGDVTEESYQLAVALTATAEHHS
jgi:hypothetical protein